MINKLILIICLLVIIIVVDSNPTHHVVFNALDVNSLTSVVAFADAISESDKTIKLSLFTDKSSHDVASDDLKKQLSKLFQIKYYTVQSLINKNVGRPFHEEEKVTRIIESINHTITINNHNNANDGELIVFISLSSSTKFIYGPSFTNIFLKFDTNHTANKADRKALFKSHEQGAILLLGKNRRVTSVSDWHDLMLFGINTANQHAIEWFKTMKETYYFHADREEYTLLDPRPAILEASIQHRHNISIGYLTRKHVGLLSSQKDDKNVNENHLDATHNHLEQVYIQLECMEHKSSCGIVEEPIHWKSSISKNIPSDYKSKHHNKDISDPKHMFASMWDGVIKFRNAPAPDTPRSYCWETG